MNEEEICTICLDILFPEESSLITRIQPCGHHYHTQCIDLWKERSNNCPTCREDYDVTEDIDRSGTVISTNSVTKLIILPADHTESFFENLSDIEVEQEPHDRIGRRINRLVSTSNICILCEQRRGSVTACSMCSSSFHYNCLGSNISEYWVCPMCDAEQRLMDRPSRFRRSRNSAITNRVYNQHRDIVIPSANNDGIENAVREVAEPMTVEEQYSWESFDLAKSERTNENQSIESMNLSGNTEDQLMVTETRKLKKPSSRRKNLRQTNTEYSVPTQPAGANNNDSLVNKILNQMKENRAIQSNNLMPGGFEAPFSSSRSHYSPSLTYSSPQSSSESSNISPLLSPVLRIEDDQDIAIRNKSEFKLPLSPGELTYEQKVHLQEIVRSKLRPIHQRRDINDEEYTNINKKVSHILYEFVTNDANNANVSLESVADYHVTQEVMNL